MSRKAVINGLEAASVGVVYPHVFPNSDREVGGVLVGKASPRGGLPQIDGAIEALSADEQRATLTFTQDAWEHIHQRLEADFAADAEIVGWYHSHPGFGIFLSEHDLFIHRNFFTGKSQIALVVDPHNQTEGVFVWDGDEIVMLYEVPTQEGWVAQSPRASFVPVETPATISANSAERESDSLGAYLRDSSNFASLAVALLLGALAGLGAMQLSGTFDTSVITSTRTLQSGASASTVPTIIRTSPASGPAADSTAHPTTTPSNETTIQGTPNQAGAASVPTSQ